MPMIYSCTIIVGGRLGSVISIESIERKVISALKFNATVSTFLLGNYVLLNYVRLSRRRSSSCFERTSPNLI